MSLRKEAGWRESHARSILKAVSWRLLAVVVTSVVTWVLTGEVRLAAAVAAADSALKIALYYFHERLWTLVGLGSLERDYADNS